MKNATEIPNVNKLKILSPITKLKHSFLKSLGSLVHQTPFSKLVSHFIYLEKIRFDRVTSCWYFVVSTNAVTRKQPEKRKLTYYKMKTNFMSFSFRVGTSVNDCFSHLKLVFLVCLFN